MKGGFELDAIVTSVAVAVLLHWNPTRDSASPGTEEVLKRPRECPEEAMATAAEGERSA